VTSPLSIVVGKASINQSGGRRPTMAAAAKTELQNNANRSIGRSYCAGFAGDGNKAAAGVVACRYASPVTVGTRNSLFFILATSASLTMYWLLFSCLGVWGEAPWWPWEVGGRHGW
jgi:hypothetical protein